MTNSSASSPPRSSSGPSSSSGSSAGSSGAGSPAGTSGGVGSSTGGSAPAARDRLGAGGSVGGGCSATRAASSAATASQVPESAVPAPPPAPGSPPARRPAPPRRWVRLGRRDGRRRAPSVRSCSPLTGTPRRCRASGLPVRHLVVGAVVVLGRRERATGPAHVQLPQRRQLLEDDPLLPVELEQRQEPGDHLEGVRAVGGERAEGRRPGSDQVVAHDEQLLGDADRGGVQVGDADPLRHLRGQRPGREQQRTARGSGPARRRASDRRTAAPGRRPGEAPGGLGLALAQEPGRLLVGLVLQQPGEEEVTGLEQLEVVLVVDLGGRQQPGGLEVEEGGGDDEELAGLVEVQFLAQRAQVRDELVGDLRQRDLGDVELVLADQLQQQVERALEVGQLDGETRRRGTVGLGGRVPRRCCRSRTPSVGVHRGSTPRSRRTSTESSPRSSRSESRTAIASRTIRPRSAATRAARGTSAGRSPAPSARRPRCRR